MEQQLRGTVRGSDGFEERAALWSNQQISGISVSKGIALSEDQPDMNINELIDLADQRMYADKRGILHKNRKAPSPLSRAPPGNQQGDSAHRQSLPVPIL